MFKCHSSCPPLQGTLEYQTVLHSKPRMVKAGGSRACVAEVALWGTWFHCGQLIPKVFCEMTSMDARRFREIVTKTHANGDTVIALKRYAVAFARLVKPCTSELDEPLVTDIINDDARLEEIIAEAFHDHMSPEKPQTASARAKAAGSGLLRSVSRAWNF